MATIDKAGLDIIEQFEGCRLEAYCNPGDVPTIGYGHTGPDVHLGLVWTQSDAERALGADVMSAQNDVARLVEIALTPNQFSALVSWQYNTGALAGSPGLALINEKQFQQAWDDHFCLWIKDGNGNVLPGLIRRRAAERALFFTP